MGGVNMKEIKLGRILLEHRHKRGITQDELAEFMGISKASVSKWETGMTYPDITLLPKLAAFFNISIDELMGYEPQMTREEIRELYGQLSRAFSDQPFDSVMEHCRTIVKNYYSCMPLLFQMGILYVNHSMLSGTPELTAGIMKEARELFIRVREESDDTELATQAINMEAFCLLQLGMQQEVLDLLEPLEVIRLSPEPLLASAYEMTGNRKEAKKLLQAGIYQSVMELLNLMAAYMGVCMENPRAFEETYQRMEALSDAFCLKTLHPSTLLSFYLAAAQHFLVLGNQEQALYSLECYTELVLSDIYPLQLHGDAYFDLLDEWIEQNLLMGNAMPRDESIVRKSMIEAVADNPAFASLQENRQFQRMIQRLRTGKEVLV